MEEAALIKSGGFIDVLQEIPLTVLWTQQESWRLDNQCKATWVFLIHGILPAYPTHFLWSISLYLRLSLAASLVVCWSLISKGP